MERLSINETPTHRGKRVTKTPGAELSYHPVQLASLWHFRCPACAADYTRNCRLKGLRVTIAACATAVSRRAVPSEAWAYSVLTNATQTPCRG